VEISQYKKNKKFHWCCCSCHCHCCSCRHCHQCCCCWSCCCCRCAYTLTGPPGSCAPALCLSYCLWYLTCNRAVSILLFILSLPFYFGQLLAASQWTHFLCWLGGGRQKTKVLESENHCLKRKKAVFSEPEIPVCTCDTTIWVHGMAQVCQIGYHTCTRSKA
jgi:hypothetical protein